MTNKQILKQQKKYFKNLRHKYNKLFKKIRKKIKNIPGIERVPMCKLINDLIHTNQDCMDVLGVAEPFTSREDYIKTVQAYFNSEMDTYDYKYVLLYEVGNMKTLIEIVTKQHNKMDGIAKIRAAIFKHKEEIKN